MMSSIRRITKYRQGMFKKIMLPSHILPRHRTLWTAYPSTVHRSIAAKLPEYISSDGRQSSSRRIGASRLDGSATRWIGTSARRHVGNRRMGEGSNYDSVKVSKIESCGQLIRRQHIAPCQPGFPSIFHLWLARQLKVPEIGRQADRFTRPIHIAPG